MDIHKFVTALRDRSELEALEGRLDSRRGCLFASTYEYPSRYSRWDVGFSDPPLVFEARERSFRFEALNDRGRVLLPAFVKALKACAAVERLDVGEGLLSGWGGGGETVVHFLFV